MDRRRVDLRHRSLAAVAVPAQLDRPRSHRAQAGRRQDIPRSPHCRPLLGRRQSPRCTAETGPEVASTRDYRSYQGNTTSTGVAVTRSHLRHRKATFAGEPERTLMCDAKYNIERTSGSVLAWVDPYGGDDWRESQRYPEVTLVTT